MPDLSALRAQIRKLTLAHDGAVLGALMHHAPDTDQRAAITEHAAGLVRDIRADGNSGLMEVFLAEYGLSTDEGIALMCLAEALLRVPDDDTIDALIEDKIAPSAWGAHLGHSSSSLVNASTWALMLTGKVLREDSEPGIVSLLHSAVKRLGEPVIRAAVSRAMREMGQQFVLGETVKNAMKRGAKMVARGYTYSYDMLGEAALTNHDAAKYRTAYEDAMTSLAGECQSRDSRENPGISIKLSALYPRYEEPQCAGVMADLVPTVLQLAQQAKSANMGLNIDAEEADRLDLSLDVIEAVLRDPTLAGWDGFGVVVQAYGKRASAVIDWLQALAETLDRRIMVRLVKGAYWDTEIKRAQVLGLAGFPVFTRKPATDVSYICCAAQLLGADRIYPQFATHNAHTMAAILALAPDPRAFEFQRLHGMGEVLHDMVLRAQGTRCRIYAPVGAHRDLLAYLVRRLLENGANSSFVHQIVDENVRPETVAADPFAALSAAPASGVTAPADLYAPTRPNAHGWDLHDRNDIAAIEAARAPFVTHVWQAGPLVAAVPSGGDKLAISNPANPTDAVGRLTWTSLETASEAVATAQLWDAPVKDRIAILNAAADLYQDNFGELFALLAREAGKSLPDAVSELREAVDFLRYYASEAEKLTAPPRGVMTCISPWNFPLAIFTGQIAAALAAGNAVLAKPSEATSLIAHRATQLLHDAGVPRTVLQLLPGPGATIGHALTKNPRIGGVVFTGSTATARSIHRSMAPNLPPDAPLIAETGGLNAMVVDSSALPEQAVRDIVASAFQSAGQRCSALRMLYVQEDVAGPLLKMLFGAMDVLLPGDPWLPSTDIGPVIDTKAKRGIDAYIEKARAEGRVLKHITVPRTGHFVTPAVIQVSGFKDLKHEVFGPVLHVATFAADEIDAVVDAINTTGYGLTFGMHSRIDDRVDQVTRRLRVGNIYINRNQIGAVVGSQPFGGEGLSGTGPKAGGPHYLPRLTKSARRIETTNWKAAPPDRIESALAAARPNRMRALAQNDLPGPTGESNRLTVVARGTVLCLGPGDGAAAEQAQIARDAGCAPVSAPGLPAEMLSDLSAFDLVAFWGNDDQAQAIRTVLAARIGPIIPLATGDDLAALCRIERHICIDTTAAGGNAALLAATDA